MNLTDTQYELLFVAQQLSYEDRGMVVEDDAFLDAHRLAEGGWLERRFESNGDMSWWWTREGETALALGNLTAPPEGPNLN